MARLTKASQLLKVAVAAHRRGETEIAKDICVLAMEEEDMDILMDDLGDPSSDESVEDLEQQLSDAMASGDYDAAEEVVQKLRAMSDAPADDMPIDDLSADLDEGMEFVDMDDAGLDDMGDEDMGDEDLGDEDLGDEDPMHYLSDAQIASVIKVARKINSAGHADLAKQITDKLGL